MYESCIKRLLDLILSLAACVVLAIPMGIIALWIKKDSPGPVFFKQRRVGRGKKCFNILKFRTMRGDTPHDVPTHLLKNADSYITKSGAFLRRTSLDELPQIYNIVAGQMSIIGPRPALYNQYDLIAARDAVHANDIRPGLTGLAQINGRDEPRHASTESSYTTHSTGSTPMRWAATRKISGSFFSIFRSWANRISSKYGISPRCPSAARQWAGTLEVSTIIRCPRRRH